MAKKEFTLENEYTYSRTGPVKWIISHVARYPIFPLLMLLAAVVNNLAYSSIQLLVGRAFDLITTPGWQMEALIGLALTAIALALTQGLTGLGRNYSGEFLAQRLERDIRDEFYINLLGKSQSFHGRQHIGDIMARATNDVRSVNLMFSPGLNLIIDSLMGIIAPMLLISRINPALLIAPVVFLVLFAITIQDYNRQLKPVSLAQREQFGKMNAGLAEAISGIETVKANVQEHYEWAKFTQNAGIFRNYFVEQGKIQARYLPVLMFSLVWAGAFLHALLMWHAAN